MTSEMYSLFKLTNPRIRSYERDKKGRVLVSATCSGEHKKTLESLVEICKRSNEDSIQVLTEDNGVICFSIISNLDFTDLLIRDFLK